MEYGTITISIDEESLKKIDLACKISKRTRSNFMVYHASKMAEQLISIDNGKIKN